MAASGSPSRRTKSNGSAAGRPPVLPIPSAGTGALAAWVAAVCCANASLLLRAAATSAGWAKYDRTTSQRISAGSLLPSSVPSSTPIGLSASRFKATSFNKSSNSMRPAARLPAWIWASAMRKRAMAT